MAYAQGLVRPYSICAATVTVAASATICATLKPSLFLACLAVLAVGVIAGLSNSGST